MKKGADVDGFLRELRHARMDEVLALRALVAAAHPGLVEGVKWNAPSYAIGGEHRVTFRLQPKDVVQLVLHRDAKKRDDDFTFEDSSGLVAWAAPDRGVVTFSGMDDVRTKAEAVRDLVDRWVRATT